MRVIGKAVLRGLCSEWFVPGFLAVYLLAHVLLALVRAYA